MMNALVSTALWLTVWSIISEMRGKVMFFQCFSVLLQVGALSQHYGDREILHYEMMCECQL